MELQIQDLVASIRKEGVDAANKEAAEIVAQAQKKADSIVQEAKSKAQAEKDAAAKEIGILKESAAVGAEQAKRDAMLSFKAEVQAEFEKILSVKVKEAMKDSVIADLIKAALNGEDASAYAAEISGVNEGIKAELAKEISEGLEIRPTKGVSYGFRLAAKDGSGYFDCSDEEVMKMLMPYFRNLDF